jgi:hypothetical protein
MPGIFPASILQLWRVKPAAKLAEFVFLEAEEQQAELTVK